MLKRNIINDLIAWKTRKHHPLIIKGLRQTGKTFIAKQFGKEFYSNTVYIDLRANTTIHDAFSGDFSVDQMVMAITANMPTARFIPGKTLLILDEIQDCPNARSSLKYWDIDGRYDVIATGSFLGVKGFRAPYKRGIPVGYEEQINMYPLSFEEFLINTGMDSKVLSYVRSSLRNGVTIEKTVHESMRALYLQYLVVGGMPEACNCFFETHDLNNVRVIQRRILSSIKDDFGRYQDEKGNNLINGTLKLRAEACLNSLPSQLSKEYKKFQYSLVDVKGKSPEKADGLQYIEDLGLVLKSYNTRELSYPLEGVKIPTEFKVFVIDTGLLVSILGSDAAAKILNGDLSAYKGAIAENMVASAFAENGRELYYYHAKSGSPELDFICEENGDITILECKATNNRATSMKFVISNPKRFGKHKAVKIADTNIGHGEGFITYPLYAIGFMKAEEEPLKAKPVNVEALKVPEEFQ